MRTGSLLLCAALLLTGCAQKGDLEAERTAVLQADREWLTAVQSKDVERTVSFWSDDAVLMPPDMPPMAGKEAIHRYVSESMKLRGFSLTWRTEQVSLSASGDVAYATGRNRFTLHNEKGEQLIFHGKGMTVWRKQHDGSWRCVLDIWNSVPSTDPGRIQ